MRTRMNNLALDAECTMNEWIEVLWTGFETASSVKSPMLDETSPRSN